MNEIVWYGYELSGVDLSGLAPDGIVERSYVLYAGRRPKSVYGDIRLVRRLDNAEVAALRVELDALPTECASGVLTALARKPHLPPTAAAGRASNEADYGWNPYSTRS
jgi:hypothetical protein